MRVIAGQYRGMRLRSPKGRGTRPTADRVKESLFNRLGARVPEATVLDLFAGSGQLGIEALSRGARAAVFVEADRAARQALEANLAHTGCRERARVLGLDALAALERLAREGAVFDLVFADPPYRQGWVARLLAAPSLRSVVGPGGLVVVEHEAGLALPPGWRVVNRSRYGGTEVSLLEEDAVASPLSGHL
jgi:16S rRNA (guanine966-N2)-methyltransferase